MKFIFIIIVCLIGYFAIIQDSNISSTSHSSDSNSFQITLPTSYEIVDQSLNKGWEEYGLGPIVLGATRDQNELLIVERKQVPTSIGSSDTKGIDLLYTNSGLRASQAFKGSSQVLIPEKITLGQHVFLYQKIINNDQNHTLKYGEIYQLIHQGYSYAFIFFAATPAVASESRAGIQSALSNLVLLK